MPVHCPITEVLDGAGAAGRKACGAGGGALRLHGGAPQVWPAVEHQHHRHLQADPHLAFSARPDSRLTWWSGK